MDLTRALFQRILLLITVSAGIVWGIFHASTVGGLLRAGLSILTPFVLGLCIAYLVNLLLRPIESAWDRISSRPSNKTWIGQLKRPICILLSTATIAGVFFILLFIVIPEVVSTIATMIDMLPSYLTQVESWWTDLSEALLDRGVVLPQFQLDGAELSVMARGFLAERGLSVFGKTVDITASIISWGMNFFIAIVFCLYVLAQKEILGRQIRKLMFALFSHKTVDAVLEVASLTNRTFAKFVTGQLTDALIVGILCFLGMIALSLPYPTTIAVLVGATSVIPIFGALIGTAIGALFILMVDPMKALWFIIFIIVLQQVESNVIYPKVVGKSVGLPGIWVLVSITIGGSLFGLLGMIVSVPVGSVLYTLLKKTVHVRLSRRQKAR